MAPVSVQGALPAIVYQLPVPQPGSFAEVKQQGAIDHVLAAVRLLALTKAST